MREGRYFLCHSYCRLSIQFSVNFLSNKKKKFCDARCSWTIPCARLIERIPYPQLEVFDAETNSKKKKESLAMYCLHFRSFSNNNQLQFQFLSYHPLSPFFFESIDIKFYIGEIINLSRSMNFIQRVYSLYISLYHTLMNNSSSRQWNKCNYKDKLYMYTHTHIHSRHFSLNRCHAFSTLHEDDEFTHHTMSQNVEASACTKMIIVKSMIRMYISIGHLSLICAVCIIHEKSFAIFYFDTLTGCVSLSV